MARSERRLELRTAGWPGLIIDLKNLAGHLLLEPSSGPEVELSALVVVEADDEDECRRLASAVEIVLETHEGTLLARAIYPELPKLRYPTAELSRGAVGTRGDIGVLISYQGSPVAVSSRADSGAPVLYVDLRLRVPAGAKVEAWNGVGNVEAAGLGTIALSTECGDVVVRQGTGGTRVTTRTGDVLVVERTGDLEVRTLSGDAAVVASSGRISVESGSGDVALERVEGKVRAASGSGDVRARAIAPRGILHLRSGSGDVSLESPGFLPGESREGIVLGTLAEADVRLSAPGGSVHVTE